MISLRHVTVDYRSHHSEASPWASSKNAAPPSTENTVSAESTSSAQEAPSALSNISLNCAPGTLTLLCGPSGGGKSTLLRSLNGMVPHVHSAILTGSLTVDGHEISQLDLSEAGEFSSTVFQNPRTQFFATHVDDELAFRPGNYGVPAEDIRASIDSAARTLAITDLLDRPLSDLSGGELQRVACAQALVSKTSVVLMDEPTSNLSLEAIADLRGAIQQLLADGHTLVIAEHRLHFLRDLCDQVLRIAGGHITHRWSGDDFFNLPLTAQRTLGLRSLTPPPPTENWSRLIEQKILKNNPDDLTGDLTGRRNETPPENRGLVITNLHHRYGKQTVLNESRLEFPAGTVTAIVGPNGVGKTTLSRIICGLMPPSSKATQFFMDGRPLRQKKLLSMSAVVMQDVNRQLCSAHVHDEVTLSSHAHALTSDEVMAILERCDLASFAQRHPQSLSGGQKQRVAIAAAIAQNARIHVWDEPTSGVDAEQMRKVAKQLRTLADEGIIVVVVTHDWELVSAAADRVIRLKD